MNALDILHYGDREVRGAFDGLDSAEWNRTGVTRRWSPKDVLAHLSSFEIVLEDVLRSAAGEPPSPAFDRFTKGHATFNDSEVEARRSRSADDILREYDAAHERVMDLARRLGPERLRQVGTIPWYGPDYSIDDFIVYANYAHKREHCAQVKRFRQA
ncbi:MAG TPA: DinB family protein [Candidatus Udaeobacter sp.]|jgi:hypothetical protein|nr:DinB family protein [Candidatus Udaeobacter sp.]